MKKYSVFFEAFGKKLKCDVFAKNQDEARLEVFKKITFIKFFEQPIKEEPDIPKFMKDAFGW